MQMQQQQQFGADLSPINQAYIASCFVAGSSGLMCCIKDHMLLLLLLIHTEGIARTLIV